MGAAGRSRDFGDCWQYHLLAEGKIDVVVDPHVKLWDIAPAKIICEEAGGVFTSVQGSTSFGADPFIAVASNGLVHDEVLQYFE